MRLRNQANVAQQTSSFFDTFVFYAMSNELGSVAGTCDTDPATDSKTFNVTGQAAGEEGLLGYGGSVVTLASATPSVNVNVAPGTYDWLAMWGPTPGLPDLTHDWNAYRIGRGEAVPGSAVAVDRTGASAFVSSPFTVTGGTGGSLWNFSQSLEGASGGRSCVHGVAGKWGAGASVDGHWVDTSRVPGWDQRDQRGVHGCQPQLPVHDFRNPRLAGGE